MESNNLPATTMAKPPEKNRAIVQRAGVSQTLPVFASTGDFENAQRIADMMSRSALVPALFQQASVGQAQALANCVIALEFAGQVGMSVFSVMQNMHIIQNRPSLSTAFLISCFNQTGNFSPLRYERKEIGKVAVEKVTWEGDKGNRKKKVEKVDVDDFAFRAKATDLSNGEVLYGTWVNLGLAHAEGWFDRAGSKYATMPEQMLMYRAASFFIRAYAPEISMGMHTKEENEFVEYEDVTPGVQQQPKRPRGADKVNSAMATDPPPPPMASPDLSVLPDVPPPPANDPAPTPLPAATIQPADNPKDQPYDM